MSDGGEAIASTERPIDTIVRLEALRCGRTGAEVRAELRNPDRAAVQKVCITALRSRHPGARLCAADELAVLGDAHAQPALIDRLREGDDERATIETLRALLERVQDPSEVSNSGTPSTGSARCRGRYSGAQMQARRYG